MVVGIFVSTGVSVGFVLALDALGCVVCISGGIDVVSSKLAVVAATGGTLGDVVVVGDSEVVVVEVRYCDGC